MTQSINTARVLIYSATKGYRHDSIPTAVQALKNHGSNINVEFTATEDETTFRDGSLSTFDAVVFLSTFGEVLTDAGKTAFQKWLNMGGNFIGIHSASASLFNTTWYQAELGALFDYHPEFQRATIDVLDHDHPSTSMLPAQWHVEDEIYNFTSDPRNNDAVVILSADVTSYTDTGTRKYDHGTPHPIAWYQERGAGVAKGGISGRSFYTSLGHSHETWKDQTFMGHVLGGISWALASKTTRAFNSSGQVGQEPGITNSGPNNSGIPATLVNAGMSSLPA